MSGTASTSGVLEGVVTEVTVRMIQRDIGAEPMTSGAANNGIFSFCEFEYVPVYRPPWQ
jgi:hypothetical protein